MTLEALLTFFGILLAALAIARPVQHRSLSLFIPRWPLTLALLTSLALIICHDAPFGRPPLFGWPLERVMFGLTLGAFLVPVIGALWCWQTWRHAKLTKRNAAGVEEVFKAALREREFDEVERILRRNQGRLAVLPAGASSVLFDRAMVRALVDSHSLVHLELLADKQFYRILENPHIAVDAVVRELLHSDVSPIRSAVVSRYGGLDPFKYTDNERSLMERTFQNPTWYHETSAQYPLAVSAWEALRSGKYDADYNDLGRDYEARQGVSKRAFCPIYLAVKAQVLAVDSALHARDERDFYVSNLFDAFRFVQERSRFDERVWGSALANWEFPTPFAYLLYEVAYDLESLACTAVEKAIRTSGDTTAIDPPGRVARDLAANWSCCVWSIANSKQQVSERFRNSLIREYLNFILKLGWGPGEICFRGQVPQEGLDEWRDLFWSELAERFRGREFVHWMSLQEALLSLDQGKGYVFEGGPWLSARLDGI